eukprot:m.130421 g.130421  ORF g.130421 m.130421 type:complete len:302 (-) comp16433_c0_seq4:1026-1931(-)
MFTRSRVLGRLVARISRQSLQSAPEAGGPMPGPFSATVMKPFLFATGVCFVGSAAAHAAEKHYPEMRREYEYGMRKYEAHRRIKMMQIRGQQPGLWEMLKFKWDTMHPMFKTLGAIVTANVGVFLLWRVPAAHGFLTRYFLHQPWTGRSLQLLGSGFSHIGFGHLALNMVAMVSMAPSVYADLGHNNFLAFFTAAGVMSGLTSHVFHLLRRSTIPSLGASGIVYALFAYSAMKHPDERVFLLILPFFSFTMMQGLMGAALFDIVGAFSKWTRLDHFGHLGGMLYGVTIASTTEQQKPEPWR